MKVRRIKLSFVCFFSSIISAIALSPLFGNFTPDRLPVLLVVALVFGLVWGYIGGTVLDIP